MIVLSPSRRDRILKTWDTYNVIRVFTVDEMATTIQCVKQNRDIKKFVIEYEGSAIIISYYK